MNKSRSKLNYINSIESPPLEFPEIDTTRPKYLVCFPYPYMNGKLHLGHLYTYSKLEFMGRYKKLQGYNVMFPFGYHCTGMPISASAYKLQQELEGKPVDVSVMEILRGLGFENFKDFTDPLHWIRTFPKFANESLTKFESIIDWRQSFVTTDINPYYDSFIQYQFRKLRKANVLNFGKRYSIFCTVNQQACLDHDRRKGEGLKPVDVMLRKIQLKDSTLLIRCYEPKGIAKVVISSEKKFVKFSYKNQYYTIESELYDNIKYQVDSLEEICIINGNDIICESIKVDHISKLINGKITHSENFDETVEEFQTLSGLNNEQMILVESSNYVRMSEPEGEIISRAGAKCVVALLDQWYIDYGITEWKEKARRCIDSMTIASDTRAKLCDALDWINKWGFSRSFGLGTHIPWDPQYLIDSLSDSTIYYAFYTFKHLMFNDLEGKDEIFPSELLSDDVFEYIFGDVDTISPGLLKYFSILNECRSRFEYFYPVDILNSGKDLIGNHLIFFIFNHVALFNEKFWPKRIYTNGHLMLNSRKMSKSDGNYLTVEDALVKFGASATRMCLADCGDTNEDANFVEETANSIILRLYSLIKTVEGLEVTEVDNLSHMLNNMNIDTPEYNNFIDSMLLQYISKHIKLTLENYENMIYKDVLKHGFYELLKYIELYFILKGNNKAVVSYFYKSLLQLMYPIIPSVSLHLLNLKFNGEFTIPNPVTDKDDKIKAFEYVKNICSYIITHKKKFECVIVCIGKTFSEWKTECMKYVDSCTDKNEIARGAAEIFKKYDVTTKKGLSFAMDYFKSKEKYIQEFNEFNILSLFKEYAEGVCGIKIELLYDDKYDPYNPGYLFK